MYGVVLHFNDEAEQAIKMVWSELSDRSLSKYAEEVKDRRPHITLASYLHLNESHFVANFREFYKDKKRFTVHINALGSFFQTGLLFAMPTPTIELLQFHAAHHHHFAKYQDNPDSFYLPGRWMPHCTIANRLSSEKWKEVFDYCSKRMKGIEGQINEVSLIKLVDKHTVPTVETCFLNNN